MLVLKPCHREVLILGNGPSLLTHPLGAVPRDRVFILGVNQSWRVFPAADAHFAQDGDQFAFDDPVAAGYGGRPYYEALDKRRTVYHTGAWPNFGVKLDRNDQVVFGRHPFRKRHRGAHTDPPTIQEDGGVALKVDPSGSAGSSTYIALQIAAAMAFDVFWLVGLDMGADPRKFDGANGFTGVGKKVPTTVGAWSNSQRHDHLWSRVPRDVRDRVRVIAPSATKVLTVVDWPWPASAEAVA